MQQFCWIFIKDILCNTSQCNIFDSYMINWKQKYRLKTIFVSLSFGENSIKPYVGNIMSSNLSAKSAYWISLNRADTSHYRHDLVLRKNRRLIMTLQTIDRARETFHKLLQYSHNYEKQYYICNFLNIKWEWERRRELPMNKPRHRLQWNQLFHSKYSILWLESWYSILATASLYTTLVHGT